MQSLIIGTIVKVVFTTFTFLPAAGVALACELLTTENLLSQFSLIGAVALGAFIAFLFFPVMGVALACELFTTDKNLK